MNQLIGQALGRYQIKALLGRGGMAAVYRAVDPAFERVVAVKVLAPALVRDPQFVARFLREARAIARLHHPHIIPVYDVGEQDGMAYFVMPHAEGTLRDFLDSSAVGQLRPATAVALLRPVAAALDYAHEQGVIHRDVKPTNILLTAQGHPLLADFGIAKVLAQSGLTTLTVNVVLGTVEYMSPEQGQGLPLDGRSDLYSLGVVLYEALTGRTPFREGTPTETPMSLIIKHVTAEPPPPRALNPTLSRAIEAVLLRALAKDPNDRFPTGAALFAALDAALAAGPIVPAARAKGRGQWERAAMAAALTTVLQRGRGAERAPEADDDAVSPPSPVPTVPMASPSPRRGRGLSETLRVAAALLPLLLGVGVLIAVLAGGGVRRASPASPVAAATTPTGALVAGAATATGASPTASAQASPVPTATLLPTALPTAVAPATATRTGQQELILFASRRDDARDTQIFVMYPDGSGQQQLIRTSGRAWGPRISPDGQRVVFSAIAAEPGAGPNRPASQDIYVATAAGSDIVRLTEERSWDNAWAWSPDGKWIVFASDRSGNYELYRMTAAGEQVTRLTDNQAADGWPSWTPDGRQIVFASERAGASQIFIMDQDGANVRRLLTSESSDTIPVVSPDGTKLVYSAWVPGQRLGEIYVANIDGSSATRLTRTTTLNTDSAWSPDGTKIAFVSYRNGNSDIYVMNADGSGQTRLTTNPQEDVTPSWGYLQAAQRSSGAKGDPAPRATWPPRSGRAPRSAPARRAGRRGG